MSLVHRTIRLAVFTQLYLYKTGWWQFAIKKHAASKWVVCWFYIIQASSCYMRVLHDGAKWGCYMKVLHEGAMCVATWGYYIRVLNEGAKWGCYMLVLHEGSTWGCYMMMLHEGATWGCYMRVLQKGARSCTVLIKYIQHNVEWRNIISICKI